MQREHRATFRMPDDVKAFLATEAKRNCTSLNAETIRAVRERMERTTAARLNGSGALTKSSNHEPLERR